MILQTVTCTVLHHGVKIEASYKYAAWSTAYPAI